MKPEDMTARRKGASRAGSSLAMMRGKRSLDDANQLAAHPRQIGFLGRDGMARDFAAGEREQVAASLHRCQSSTAIGFVAALRIVVAERSPALAAPACS